MKSFFLYSKSLILKTFGAFISFFLLIAIKDKIGINGFGKYAYIMSLASLLSSVLIFGSNNVILSEIPKIDSIIKFNSKLKLIRTIPIFFVLIYFILSFLLFYYDLSNLSDLILIGVISFLLSNNKINMSIMRASNYPLISELPELIIRPTIIILFIHFLNVNNTLNVILILVFSLLISNATGSIFISKKIIKNYYSKVGSIKFHNHFKKTYLLVFISFLVILRDNIEIYILPFLTNIENVGYFKIYVQLSLLLSFGLQAVNIPQSYLISKKLKDPFPKINIELINGFKFSGLFFIGLSSIYLIVGNQLISFFFGSDVVDNLISFKVMMLGQFIYVLIGPMGQTLILSKKIKYVFISLLISVINAFFFGYFLIYYFGLLGAAISYVFSLSVLHFAYSYFAYKYLKVKPSFLIYYDKIKRKRF